MYAADSDYQTLELVEGGELRLAYARDGLDERGDGGFSRDIIWWGATAWHESLGPDFVAHYEIRGLSGLTGCPIVTFSGFALDFQGTVDSRIDFTSAVVEPVSYHAGTLRMRITGGLRDRNYDLPYNWRVYFQIAGWPPAASS